MWSAVEIAAAVRSRRVSPVEIVQVYLERIERLNPQLNAYITVCAEGALQEARQMERSIRERASSLPLAGVPIAVKDQFWTKDVLTTNGSAISRDFIPNENATVITRARTAGAILLGKLNMSEFAMGGTRNPVWGIPRNPWDFERTPGESSSGSGVAVAANLCACSIAEDTGGSGRGPANYCGVVGLRPTFGLVSRFGMTPMCWFMDTVAPVSKTVGDCALILSAIAGYDDKDPYTSRRPVPDYSAQLQSGIVGLRLGVISEFQENEQLHPEVRQATTDALEVFRSLGAEVREVSIPLAPVAGAIFVGIADTEAASALDQVLRERAQELDPGTRTRLQSAALVPHMVYNRAMKARALLRSQFLDALSKVDVLVSATYPYPPPLYRDVGAPFRATGDVQSRFFFRRAYTACYALAAMPAISLPGGFMANDLPIGIQLGTRPFGEELLLRVAYAYEHATPWHRMRAPAAE